MKDIDKYPKSVTRFVRYIKQDVPQEQLEEIKQLINSAINRRKWALERITK